MVRGGLYFDSTYILILIGFLIAMAASSSMKASYNKYRQIRCMAGLTGAEVAAKVLRSAGIVDVQIRPVSGSLTDHYDPRSKTVNLSDEIYRGTSIASVSVAAHECGHAIQHHVGYAPLNFRSSMVPAVNIGSNLSWPIFFAGLLFGLPQLATAGIILFSLAVLFQLVTLPVEFDASRRALLKLDELGIVGADEHAGAKKMLTAAALTYVAALLQSVLQLLRLIMIANRNGGRRRR